MLATYLKLLATTVFWGGTFVAGRILTPHIGPFSAAFLRFVVASTLLVLLTLRTEGRMPRLVRGQRLPVLLLGLTGIFAYNAFFFSGLQTVAAGRAALIVAANPVAILILSALFLGEPLGLVKLVGICLSVTGAAVVISHGDPAAVLAQGLGRGELLILGCVASWAAYSVIGKSVMKGLSPTAAVTMSCLAGTAMLLPPALIEGLAGRVAALPAAAWGSILYLGVLGTVLGFTWYYQGIRRLGASRAAVFINFVPVSAVLLGWGVLGETVDLSLLAGAALVSAGVWLANRPVKKM